MPVAMRGHVRVPTVDELSRDCESAARASGLLKSSAEVPPARAATSVAGEGPKVPKAVEAAEAEIGAQGSAGVGAGGAPKAATAGVAAATQGHGEPSAGRSPSASFPPAMEAAADVEEEVVETPTKASGGLAAAADGQAAAGPSLPGRLSAAALSRVPFAPLLQTPGNMSSHAFGRKGFGMSSTGAHGGRSQRQLRRRWCSAATWPKQAHGWARGP